MLMVNLGPERPASSSSTQTNSQKNSGSNDNPPRPPQADQKDKLIYSVKEAS